MVDFSQHPDFSAHNYQIIRELGRNREGGRISYLATTLDETQQVVIKQFRFAQVSTSWQGYKAYQREIEILQSIDHTCIPKYLASFETADGFCMVQEYKNATSLAEKNNFSPTEIKQILVSILEILVDLQRSLPPIIHRDIKPENILIDQDNQAYLIDFGLARVNSQDIAISSVVAGTPGFTPPEELFQRPLTTASDLYSVGATAIALITKTPSHKLSTLIDDSYRLKFRHLTTGINPDFMDWLDQMVAPNSSQRFSDAASALAKLKALPVVGTSAHQTKSKNKSRIDYAIAKVSGIIALCTIISLSWLQSQPNTAENPKSSKQTVKVVRKSSPAKVDLSQERAWFQNIKSRCNALEVTVAFKNSPPHPDTPQGVGYAASCYALAGKINRADELIQPLSPEESYYAAAVVFAIGHPIADAGDDESAGGIMELVLRYWPNNFMARYHAGMSAYVLGDYPKAEAHLLQFLVEYRRSDSWTNKAKSALTRMEQNIPADASFSIHH